jgi:hypothetical protein
MTNINEDVLIHYGKLGMKWGRRSSGRSAENVTVGSLKKKSARSLSDAELKQAIGRMKLEKQYKDLNPKGISRGYKVALGVLDVGATVNTAMQYKDTAAGQFIKNQVTKAISIVKR